MAAAGGQGERKKEIIEYNAPWMIYAMAWSSREDRPFRLAIGSFIEEYANKVEIIQLNDKTTEFESRGVFDHPYPATKTMWFPGSAATNPDLLATSGDYMRLWDVKETGTTLKCCLNNNKSSEFCAPLTSFDWNEVDSRLIATSSIDTTCTVWDISVGPLGFRCDFPRVWGVLTVLATVRWVCGGVSQTQQPKTQLIAHEKEVYDLAFARNADIFASAGGDGSIRTFDLRWGLVRVGWRSMVTRG